MSTARTVTPLTPVTAVTRWRVPLVALLLILGVCLAAGLLAAAQARAGSFERQPWRQTSGPAASAPSAESVPGEVIVQLKAGTTSAAVGSLTASLGASAARDLGISPSLIDGGRIVVLKSDELAGPALVAAAEKDPNVAAASLNYIRTIDVAAPNDPLFPQLWGLNNTGQTGGTPGADIRALTGWSTSTGSRDVVVADIDTGVAYDHPDLAANMWTNSGEIPDNGIDDDGNGYVDDYYGIDTINNDSDPYDDHGHGTHTSGTIAAVGDNGIGITGVNWRARIMALKFLSAGGSGDDAGAIACIYYAILEKVRDGVNVVAINASWGGSGFNPLLSDAINVAGANGIVFCAAAGNAGVDNDVQPHYPSSYPCANIVSVAATDNNDALARWNSGGGSNWGATSVDLAAPGKSILSCIADQQVVMLPNGPFYDDMESGPGKWTAQAPWEITTQKALSPTHSWSDSPGGSYTPNVNASITTRTIDLSALPGPDAFAAHIKYDLEERYDYVFLEFSGDDGATWVTVQARTGTRLSSWETMYAAVPLRFRTSEFRARLRVQSDPSGEKDGVYVDDVGFCDVIPPAGYQAWSGTSMATPHVTGAVALAAAAFPGESMAARIARVESSVHPLPSLAGKCVTGGRLDLAAMLVPRITVSAPAAGSVWPGGSTQTVSWTLDDAVPSGEFRVWLVKGSSWYVNKQVLPVAGQTAYDAQVTVAAPAGTGYRAYVYWRPAAGSGAWVSTARSAAFTVTAGAPSLIVTAPVGRSSYAQGAALPVDWSADIPVLFGEFAVWSRSSAGAWYLGRVVPATGASTYSTSVALAVPVGTDYQSIVAWRPVVGSGEWTGWATSPGFFSVTAKSPVVTFVSPTASSVWPAGTTQSVSWSLSWPVATGEFRVWLVGSGGAWYLNRQVLAVPGSTAYATAVAVSVPPGAGYTAAVYYRPVVNGGPWTVMARSAPFTVTP